MMDLDAENETQLISLLPSSKKNLGDKYEEIDDSIKAETYTEPEKINWNEVLKEDFKVRDSSALKYLHGTTIAVAKTKYGIFLAADGMLYERYQNTDVAIDYKYDKIYNLPGKVVAAAAGNMYFKETVLTHLKRIGKKMVKKYRRYPTDALAQGCLELMTELCRDTREKNEKLALGEERTYYECAIIIAGFDCFQPKVFVITMDMKQPIDNVPVKTEVLKCHVDGLPRETLKNFMEAGYNRYQSPKETKGLLRSVMLEAYNDGFCGGNIKGYWFQISGRKSTLFDAHVDKVKCWFRRRVKKTTIIDDHVDKFLCAENRKRLRDSKLKETQI